MSGGGRFGPGRLDGERAERPVGTAHGGGGVAAQERAWDVCARGKVPRGGQVALRGFPGSIWLRARGGRSPPAAYGGRRETEHRGERGEGEGLSVISENPGTYR